MITLKGLVVHEVATAVRRFPHDPGCAVAIIDNNPARDTITVHHYEGPPGEPVNDEAQEDVIRLHHRHKARKRVVVAECPLREDAAHIGRQDDGRDSPHCNGTACQWEVECDCDCRPCGTAIRGEKTLTGKRRGVHSVRS